MKHTILTLLICICSCSTFASYHNVINQYQLPADTRRVDVEVRCKSCSKYYILYNVLYSEQIDTHFTNDFKPYYPKSSFICSSCKQHREYEELKGPLIFIAVFLGIYVVAGLIQFIVKRK